MTSGGDLMIQLACRSNNPQGTQSPTELRIWPRLGNQAAQVSRLGRKDERKVVVLSQAWSGSETTGQRDF